MDAAHLKGPVADTLGRSVTSISRVGGGDIARAYRVETPKGTYFLKVLEGAASREALEAEKSGLLALGRSGILRTPEVVGLHPLEEGWGLFLEFIPSRRGSAGEFRDFGRRLAALHSEDATRFGWEQDTYIGPLLQDNRPEQNWARFYTHKRLMPQYRSALAQGLLTPGDLPEAQTVVRWLEQNTTEVRPSLLHGDLWAGNFLISEQGEAVLIDPAIYVGHSEVDLAMSRLFGGFPPEFYQGYHEVLPAQPGLEERKSIYQLYYLLVHLNLFGGSYRTGVCQIGSRLFGL